MTVTATNSSSGPFTPNGVTTAFPFTFIAASASEVSVVRRPVSGSDVAQTGYTVSLNPGGTGTVNFATAPAAGDPIYVLSNPNFLQQINFATQGSWSPTTMNKALDRAAIREIYLKNLIGSGSVGGGGGGTKGDPGGNVLAIGLAVAVATFNLASSVAGTNLFHTEGYTTTADGGEAWYRRKAVIEADEPGQLTSLDGVRLGLVPTQDLTIEMFGGVPNNSSGGAQALNDSALEAANTFGAIIQDTYYGTVWSLKFPNAAYYFGGAGHDFKLARRWKGAESGAAIGGGRLRTQLIVPAGCKFLRPQMHNTVGETTAASTTSAAGSMFVDLDFIGNGGVEPNSAAAQNTTGYAIHPRCPIAVWNCRFRYHWNGIFNNAAAGGGGAIEGQASHCQYFLCSFEQNYNAGVWSDDQSDNNVSSFTHCNFIANGRCGAYLGDFLGDSIAPICHFRDNGARTDFFTVSSQCTYSGYRYYVNATATMATTDAALRVGNPTSNSLWTLDSAGGVHPNYPDFATFGGTFQKGGPVVADRTTNAKHTAVGYYGEGAQPPFFWNASCFVAPGTCGNLNVGYGVGIVDGLLKTTQAALLGKTRLDFGAGATGNNLNIHNSGALAAGNFSEVRFSQGYEVDGITPADFAGLYIFPSTNNLASADSTAVLRLRTAGGGGAMVDKVAWDNANSAYRPSTTNTWALGFTGYEWTWAYLRSGVKVNGSQVLGPRDTGWTADTGTAKKTATAAYVVGSALTVGAAYVQAEHTAIITRQALVEAALRDATQEIKALKDLVLAHGLAGA